jgi:exosortase A-associated hydrolase 2
LSRTSLDPAFIDGQLGKLFVLLRRPEGADPAPCVLIVPPFAEEMNKTRPMLSVVAQELAARGVASVLPDLYGTGDSAGEFRDGDWDVWLDDLERAAAWAGEQGCTVSRMLAVRLGCILASEWASRAAATVEKTVFWQPVSDGERFMTQFLRLRLAASMMEDRKETVSGLREQLRAGETLEVAGYELARGLVAQIDSARLAPNIAASLGALHWMETTRGEEGVLPPPSLQAVEAARASLPSVEVHAVPGEPFWSATEIVRIPALVNRTVRALAVVA